MVLGRVGPGIGTITRERDRPPTRQIATRLFEKLGGMPVEVGGPAAVLPS